MQPKLSHFSIFGSHAQARIPNEMRKYLEPQRKECIFFVYPNGVKGYRLICLSKKIILIEKSFYSDKSISHAFQEQYGTPSILPSLTNHRDYTSM